MRIRVLLSLAGIGGVLVFAPGAMAEPLQATTPPAKRETPPPAIPDRDLRPTPPPVPYTPGFVTPLTRTTKNGRVGIAGWTAPNPPVGSRGAADPESSGVFGFGLAAEWGRSIPPREVPSIDAGSRAGSPRAESPRTESPLERHVRRDGAGVDDPTSLR